jgi:hypothetical protein
MRLVCCACACLGCAAAGVLCGVWLNIEDKRRRFPLLNLPENKISQLVEKYGDLAKVSQTKGAGEEDDELRLGLLEGQQTPTLYDVRAVSEGCVGSVSSCDHALPCSH